MNTTQQQATEVAGRVQTLSYGFGGSDSVPTDKPKTPPRGKDPRYWIDVGKIIFPNLGVFDIVVGPEFQTGGETLVPLVTVTDEPLDMNRVRMVAQAVADEY